MVAKTVKKQTAPQGFFVVNTRSRWVEWIDKNDPDETPFRALVRTNLAFEDVEGLTFKAETKTVEVHVALAPYVYEWNAAREIAGKVEPIPAPAEADEDVFKYVPNEFFWFLFNEIKNHGAERLDPKESAPSVALPDSTDA